MDEWEERIVEDDKLGVGGWEEPLETMFDIEVNSSDQA